jgi:hypothetical protein
MNAKNPEKNRKKLKNSHKNKKIKQTSEKLE